MLCTLRKCWSLCWYQGHGPGGLRVYKSRASLQFAIRRRLGAGQWKQVGCQIYARMPFTGDWEPVAWCEPMPTIEWAE